MHLAGCRMCHKLVEVIEQRKQAYSRPSQVSCHITSYPVVDVSPQELHRVNAEAEFSPPKVCTPTPSHLIGNLLPQEIHQALLQSLPELRVVPEDASVHAHDSALWGAM